MASAIRTMHGKALMNASRSTHSYKAFRSARTVRIYAGDVLDAIAAMDDDLISLNKTYGVPGFVDVEKGWGNTRKVVLRHSCGSSVGVDLAARVQSWKPSNGVEVVYPGLVNDDESDFVYETAGFPFWIADDNKDEAPQLFRWPDNITNGAGGWDISRTSAENGEPSVELKMTTDEGTMKKWPYKFEATYTVTLRGEQLYLVFTMTSRDDKPFAFTAGLHSFFQVPSIKDVKVKGLKGHACRNKEWPSSGTLVEEDRDAVTFGDTRVDSVYMDVFGQVEVDLGNGKAIAIDNRNWFNCIVFNLGPTPDPGYDLEGCYKEYVCVGNARTDEPVIVTPMSDWFGTVTMKVVNL